MNRATQALGVLAPHGTASQQVPAGAAPPGASSLEVKGVNVAYGGGRLALRNANLTLSPGSICGLIGLNGAGKSTLFKTIMGFLPTASGSVTVAGRPVRHAQKSGLIAYVPQSEDVDWNFPVSVQDVVSMGRFGHLGLLRRPSARDLTLVDESLERVGMTALRGRQIGELSGGQRKRAFLARALAQEGQIMLLDEPFSGVDAGTTQTIVTLLGELRQQGHTVLISTHDLASVRSFCDTVVLLADRTILAAGPVQTVFTPENLARVFGGVAPAGVVWDGMA